MSEPTQALAIFVRYPDQKLILLNDDTEDQKREAVLAAARFTIIADDPENAEAIAVQQELQALRLSITKGFTDLKAPALTECQLCDESKRTALKEIIDAETALARVRGDYESLQLQKRRAEEAKRNAELAAIEREKQAEIAKATSHDQVAKIEDKFHAEVQAQVQPVFEQPKPKGSVVKEVWEINVTDVWKLARSHPMCVTITPNLTEIKALLDDGVTVAGVTAKKVVDAKVRSAKQAKAIEVQSTAQ